MNIKEILKNFDQSLITEEIANAISEEFEKAVSEKTKAQVSLEVEKALMAQDEDHAKKLKNLMEAADNDHVIKLKKVVLAINKAHAKKLKKIVESYKRITEKKADSFMQKVVSDLDKFLSLRLEKKIPYDQIKEAVENTVAAKKLSQIRSILGVDPSMVNKSIIKTIKEGKRKIDTLSRQLNEAVEKNRILTEKIERKNTAILLEKKTRGMSDSKKKFVYKILSDKSKDYIEENFNYVVEMFENGEEDRKDKAKTEATEKALSRKVIAPKLVTESSKSDPAPDGLVGEYLNVLEGGKKLSTP